MLSELKGVQEFLDKAMSMIGGSFGGVGFGAGMPMTSGFGGFGAGMPMTGGFGGVGLGGFGSYGGMGPRTEFFLNMQRAAWPPC